MIVETILARDFIREVPAALAMDRDLLGCAAGGRDGDRGGGAVAEPVARRSVGALPLFGWAGGTQLAFANGLWLPAVLPMAALAAATAGVLLFRYGFVDRQRRQVQSGVPPISCTRSGRGAGGAPRAPAARRREPDADDHVRRHSRLHRHLRGVQEQSAGSQPAAQSRLPLADDTPDPGPARHDRQIYRRLHHGVLERAARRSGSCRSCLRKRDGHGCRTRSRQPRALAAEAAADGRAFPAAGNRDRLNTGECVVGNMGSDERFSYTAHGRCREPRRAPRRPEQDLWRTDRSGRGDTGRRPILGGARTRLDRGQREGGGGAHLCAAWRCR